MDNTSHDISPKELPGRHVYDVIDADVFRRVCGRFPTGVTIVTSSSENGTPVGITANSFSSVSLVPPLLLVCIDYRSSLGYGIRASKQFVVHVLGASQLDIAKIFAKANPEKFEHVAWSYTDRGAPLIDEADVAVECDLIAEHPAGDHAIFLGLVRRAHELDGIKDPLLFHSGHLGGLASHLAAASNY